MRSLIRIRLLGWDLMLFVPEKALITLIRSLLQFFGGNDCHYAQFFKDSWDLEYLFPLKCSQVCLHRGKINIFMGLCDLEIDPSQIFSPLHSTGI